ncbi:hypothetical protein, partial [Candidatus Pantoea deserta]|uniref:hypothetical protein n=1 Tax=Candidatus Pantoea deserta TaxID=1869313 RepID=UPI001F1D2AF7
YELLCFLPGCQSRYKTKPKKAAESSGLRGEHAGQGLFPFDRVDFVFGIITKGKFNFYYV